MFGTLFRNSFFETSPKNKNIVVYSSPVCLNSDKQAIAKNLNLKINGKLRMKLKTKTRLK